MIRGLIFGMKAWIYECSLSRSCLLYTISFSIFYERYECFGGSNERFSSVDYWDEGPNVRRWIEQRAGPLFIGV